MATTLRVKVNGRWYTVEAVDLESDPATVLVDGELVEVHLDQAVEESQPASPELPPEQPTPPGPPAAGKAAGRVFASPMPGIIVSVAVQAGDQVVTGDEICVLEAMKMQQTLRADWSGVVKAVHVLPGQQVLDGDAIVELE